MPAPPPVPDGQYQTARVRRKMPSSVNDLRIKIFGDSADQATMLRFLDRDPRIQGFTTNPTLMHKAGITDYEGFARTFWRVFGPSDFL